MNILGICDSQDAGAALINNKSNNIAAVNEERLSREKLCGGLPSRSINEVLRLKNIRPEDLNLVVLASKMTPSFILRSFRKAHSGFRKKHRQFSFLLSIYILYQIIAHRTVLCELIESFFSKVILKKELKQLGINCKIVSIEHHAAHAYAAYITSGIDEILVITIDGLGDGISFTVNIGRAGRLTRIFEQNAFNDITLYYSRLTEFLGFTPIQDEGKVMGLAAYSTDYSALPFAQRLLRIDRGRFKNRNLFFSCSKDNEIYEQLAAKKKEDIAASFQLHLEDKIKELVRFWVEKTKIHDLALGGGFFANIKVNQKIAELDEINNLYVYPHMGDGGLALGAIFAVKKTKPFRLKNLFWGPAYSNEQIRQVLDANNLKYKFVEKIEEEIARILSAGKIVAHFCGRMEYGPRALGNRSILCQATQAGIPRRLNKILGRDMFMPFAPAILADQIHNCCLKANKAEYSGNFMNISFKSTEYFKNICPAVVHRDGTTRPQFVYKDANQRLYQIIDEYRKTTGIPAIVNTSFNLHEQPIVCTPNEALRVFQGTKIDYLVMENFLIEGESNG